MKKKEVFICSSLEDYWLAEMIQDKLNCYHIGSVISDQRQILYDSLSVLDGISVFVLLFSKSAARSAEIDNLLSEAFSLRMRIVPFKVDESSITDDPTWDFQLRKSQWVLGYPDIDKQMDNLIVSICRFLGVDSIQDSPTDPFEQLKRGIALEYGTNFLEINRKEAMLWLTKAAEQGNLQAMLELYRFYKNDDDDNPYGDLRKSNEWLKKACDGGHAEAQWLVATEYNMFSGEYTIDRETRLNLLESSYSHGNRRAGFDLAKILLREGTCEKSKVFSMVKDASLLNDIVIWDILGRMYRDGFGTSIDYESAAACFRKADWYGEFDLAMLYYYGQGVKQDYFEAFKILNSRDYYGDPRYFFMIGECLEYGRGVDKDDCKAAEAYRNAHKWYTTHGNSYYNTEKAQIALERAARIDAISQYTIGKELFDKKNFKRALKYFKVAASNGLPIAIYYCGVCYYYGLGVTIDEQEARIWLQKADIPGIPDATKLLGDIYFNGKGVDKDDNIAMNYYMRAAYQDYAEAETIIAENSTDPRMVKYWSKRAERHKIEKKNAKC